MKRTNKDALQMCDIVSCLKEHTDWQLDEDGHEFPKKSEVSTCDCVDEIRFTHTDTGGVLLLRSSLNKGSGTVCEGVLHQALDRRQRLNVSTDPFLTELTAAQHGIAETYETECISAVRDPVSILRVEFRSNHSLDTVSRLISTVASATEEIESLHQELLGIVRKYQ